jgi:hypothetical protein
MARVRMPVPLTGEGNPSVAFPEPVNPFSKVSDGGSS